jgi:hypothetical protein
VDASAMENELLRLYEATGEGGVLPSRAAKYFTVDKERKDLTAEEYVKYATKKGQTAYTVLTGLIESTAYKAMSDGEKVDAISRVYDYANVAAKMEVSNYDPAGTSQAWAGKAVKTAKRTGIKAEQYVALYLAKNGVVSLKDADGDTIDNSESLLVMDMIYNTEGLTEKQRVALFEDFGVGKSVIHYNKAKVAEELAKMREKAR